MLRMLRARKFDVDAASTLVQEILEYRAEKGLDTLLTVSCDVRTRKQPCIIVSLYLLLYLLFFCLFILSLILSRR